MKALIAQAMLLAAGISAQNVIDRPGKGAWCYDPIRILTTSEKKAYISEVGTAALTAEDVWHVPAPVITAMAIQESGYGATRLALKSNNIFAFKWPGATIAQGRGKFVLWCQPDWDSGNTYIAFGSRSDAVDFVASRLNKNAHYTNATQAYWAGIKAGKDRKLVALTWLKSIAKSYNYKPSDYVRAITRLIDDPVGDGSNTLWSLGSTNTSPVAHNPITKEELDHAI